MKTYSRNLWAPSSAPHSPPIEVTIVCGIHSSPKNTSWGRGSHSTQPSSTCWNSGKKLPLTRNLRHSSARLGATDTDTGYGLHICKCQVSHLGDTCAFSLWGDVPVGDKQQINISNNVELLWLVAWIWMYFIFYMFISLYFFFFVPFPGKVCLFKWQTNRQAVETVVLVLAGWLVLRNWNCRQPLPCEAFVERLNL